MNILYFQLLPDNKMLHNLRVMRKEQFHTQLLAATFAALRLAQDYVENHLSLNVKYVAVLNRSYDGIREPDERVYPDDKGKIIPDLSDTDVVDLLYRDDACPQWIDISVAGASKGVTLVRLLCCGRYHGDETRMYYYLDGTQPFGIKTPDLPDGWEEGMRFKLLEADDALRIIKKFIRFPY